MHLNCAYRLILAFDKRLVMCYDDYMNYSTCAICGKRRGDGLAQEVFFQANLITYNENLICGDCWWNVTFYDTTKHAIRNMLKLFLFGEQ